MDYKKTKRRKKTKDSVLYEINITFSNILSFKSFLSLCLICLICLLLYLLSYLSYLSYLSFKQNLILKYKGKANLIVVAYH